MCLHTLKLWLCQHHCPTAPSSPHARLLVASPAHRLSRMCQVTAALGDHHNSHEHGKYNPMEGKFQHGEYSVYSRCSPHPTLDTAFNPPLQEACQSICLGKLLAIHRGHIWQSLGLMDQLTKSSDATVQSRGTFNTSQGQSQP